MNRGMHGPAKKVIKGIRANEATQPRRNFKALLAPLVAPSASTGPLALRQWRALCRQCIAASLAAAGQGWSDRIKDPIQR
jgi:hypothetical protein